MNAQWTLISDIHTEKKHPPPDLNNIPVSVPAATVLMSSSAPLAFSITTPKTLYNKAATEKNTWINGSKSSWSEKRVMSQSFITSWYCWSYVTVILPTEPRELAHEAPCLVTMLMILQRQSNIYMTGYLILCVPLGIKATIKRTLLLYSLYITRFGPRHISSLLQTHPQTI